MDTQSTFHWARGDPTKWRLSKDKRFRRPPVLVYEKKWLLGENFYYPLVDAPRLYEEFAALGQKVAKYGFGLVHLRSKGLPMDTSYPADDWLGPPSRLSRLPGYAAYIPPLHREALQLVQDYGPLVFPDFRRPRVVLTDFFIEAYALHMVMTVAQGLEDADMASVDEGQALAMGMVREFDDRLSGAHPCFRLIGDRLVASYTCDSLLTAMWVQLHEALAGGKTWKRCKGCGRSFTQTRQGQKFHDKDCRNRYHVRAATLRAKEREQKEDTDGEEAR